MRYLNIFYLFVLLVGLGLWYLNASYNREVISFFGFAENKETEINFNYSVAVAKIHVSPGQRVPKGTPLLDVYRIKSKESLEDQPFRIAELQAKEKSWKTEKEGEIRYIFTQKDLKLQELEADLQKLIEQKKFNDGLYKGLKNVDPDDSGHSPIDSRIRALKREKTLVAASFDQKVENIESEIRAGINPYREEIKRWEAERAFELSNKTIDFQLMAPSDGVVGNIYCKEAEHIPSFKTLLSFYEPNPSLVEGFVQEDLILHVALKDSFLIRSSKDPETYCYGIVTGLGSRIVEIPERLRKITGMKTYGREVLIRIPADNNFLQKEKVVLEFLNPPANLPPVNRRSPLVDLKID